MSTQSDFVTKTRQLSTRFIEAADAFGALAHEFQFAGYTLGFEEGAFTGQDSVDFNKITIFYKSLGALLATLTDEDRVALYQIKL